jgi:hypothetical protein
MVILECGDMSPLYKGATRRAARAVNTNLA